MQTRTIRCQFDNATGHKLDARLEMPIEEPIAYALFSHCFTCTKDSLAAYRMSRQLAKIGIAVLRFDFTGLGNSKGNFAETNFSTNIDDILAASNFLAEEHNAPSLLIGHSLGGTAMLATANLIESIKAIVTIAAPSRPGHVLRHFGNALTLLEQGLASSIEVAGKHYDINPQFIVDIKKHDIQTILSNVTKPVLIINVKNDAMVSSENAQQIDMWVAGESEIFTLEKADHIISNKNDALTATEKIATWFFEI